MAKQLELEFFTGAYLSKGALKENPCAKSDLSRMISYWDEYAKNYKRNSFEKVISILKDFFNFPITITHVVYKDGIRLFSFEDEINKGKVTLYINHYTSRASLEVFIENNESTICNFYINGELNESYETKACEDREITVWSTESKVEIKLKNNVLFEILYHDDARFGMLHSAKYEDYDEFSNAKQLYNKLKSMVYEVTMYKIIDDKKHLHSSYSRFRYGEYFEEAEGCFEIRNMVNYIAFYFHKNGKLVFECLVKLSYDIKATFTSTLNDFHKIGDIGIIQKIINENYARMCNEITLPDKRFKELLKL